MKSIRKIFLYLPILIMAFPLLSSCELESSQNDELDGFWLITQVDSLETQHTLSCRDSLKFWSFQADMLRMQQLLDETRMSVYLFRFKHTGKELEVSDPHKYNRMEGNEPIGIERINEIRTFGIYTLDEKFEIETLNNKKMILKSNNLRLWFEKY